MKKLKHEKELLKHAIDAVAVRYNKMGKRVIEQAVQQGPDFWLEAARTEASVDVDDLVRTKDKKPLDVDP